MTVTGSALKIHGSLASKKETITTRMSGNIAKSFSAFLQPKTDASNPNAHLGVIAGQSPNVSAAIISNIAFHESKGGFRQNTNAEKTFDDFGDMPQKLSERLGKFSEEVSQGLDDELDMEEAELYQAMGNLGLGFVDLMEPSNMASLVMELTDSTDISELLVQDGVQELFQHMEILTQDLLDELGMNLEELELFLQQMGEQQIEGSIENPSYMTNEMPEALTAAMQHHGTAASAEHAEQEPASKRLDQPQTVSPLMQGQEVEEAPFAQEESKDSFGHEMADQSQAQTAAQGTLHNHASQGVEFVETVQQAYVDAQDIIQQIAQVTKTLASASASSIEMQLNPGNLGKVFIQVVSRDGVVTARIAAENQAVKEAMEKQMLSLRENMNQQGLKVEAVEVTIATQEFDRNLQGSPQSGAENQDKEQESKTEKRRNLTLDGLENLDEMSEEEDLAARIMLDHGNQMDMTA